MNGKVSYMPMFSTSHQIQNANKQKNREPTRTNNEIRSGKAMLLLKNKQAGELVRLEAGFEIGRGSCSATRFGVNDPEVSRRHALIRENSGLLAIEDCASLNGTFVNGRRLKPGLQHVLKKEEVIGLGNLELVVVETPDAEKQLKRKKKRHRSSILEGTVSGGIEEMKKRLLLVDERIEELQEYREKVRAHLSDAEFLKDSVSHGIPPRSDSEESTELASTVINLERETLWKVTTSFATGESHLELSRVKEKQQQHKPDYASMDEACLKNLMEEFGMKPGPRAYMVAELSSLWMRLHPNADDSETESAVMSDVEKQQKQDFEICHALTRTLSNEKLYEDILMNKTILLSNVKESLKKSGVNVSKTKLTRFLNNHGVTFKA